MNPRSIFLKTFLPARFVTVLAATIVFSTAFLAPIFSGLKPVAAQTKVSGGAAEQVAPPGENPSPQGVIRITVNLVQVDAVVTDSKGHPVTNLRPEDFEILEDGRPQTITNFSYIFTAKPAGIESRAATPPATAGIPEVPPARLGPDQVRRSIVILVDDLHITFQDMYYVRKALTKFIDNDVQPGDLVAILHTSGGLGVLQQFTNDKHVLHATAESLRYCWLYDELTLMGQCDLVHTDKKELEAVRKDFEAAGRQNATNGGTLDALEYVLGGLRELPGRKAVFLVSDGFVCPGSEQRLREIADLANRSATVVYTVGAQGLPTLSLDASVDPPMNTNPNSHWVEQAQELMWSNFHAVQWPLAHLAQQTEGLFFHNNNDLAGGMHEMMDDLSGYYLIGYKPSADTFKAGKSLSGYHHIQVMVKVRGLHVRTRPGFYGIPDEQARPVYRTRQEQLMAAIVSPFGNSGIGVQLAAQFLQKGSKDSVARLWVHIDARDLAFQDAPGGDMNGAADLMAVAFGDNGAMESWAGDTLRGALRPAEFEAGRERGMNSRIDLPIKKPGGYQVRVAVRDPASQKVGTASQFIEIPNMRPGRITLSGIVLNAKTLGESGPAVRRFKAGGRVSYELEIYNARREGATQAPNLESQVQIFRDGRLVSAQNPGAISQLLEDSERLLMSGEFALAPDLAPGDYVLLVTVNDNLAPPRYSTARQSIDFEVVP
jgi:VWFA-related protein